MSFKERFKGRTSKIAKNGVQDVLFSTSQNQGIEQPTNIRKRPQSDQPSYMNKINEDLLMSQKSGLPSTQYYQQTAENNFTVKVGMDQVVLKQRKMGQNKESLSKQSSLGPEAFQPLSNSILMKQNSYQPEVIKPYEDILTPMSMKNPTNMIQFKKSRSEVIKLKKKNSNSSNVEGTEIKKKNEKFIKNLSSQFGSQSSKNIFQRAGISGTLSMKQDNNNNSKAYTQPDTQNEDYFQYGKGIKNQKQLYSKNFHSHRIRQNNRDSFSSPFEEGLKQYQMQQQHSQSQQSPTQSQQQNQIEEEQQQTYIKKITEQYYQDMHDINQKSQYYNGNKKYSNIFSKSQLKTNPSMNNLNNNQDINSINSPYQNYIQHTKQNDKLGQDPLGSNNKLRKYQTPIHQASNLQQIKNFDISKNKSSAPFVQRQSFSYNDINLNTSNNNNINQFQNNQQQPQQDSTHINQSQQITKNENKKKIGFRASDLDDHYSAIHRNAKFILDVQNNV